jgi:hypothetical protein
MFVSYVETKYVDHDLLEKRKRKIGPPSDMKRKLNFAKTKFPSKVEKKPKNDPAKKPDSDNRAPSLLKRVQSHKLES